MFILLNLVSNTEITLLIKFWLVLNYCEYVFSYEIWKPSELSECLVLPVNSNQIILTEKGRERKRFVVSNPRYEKTPHLISLSRSGLVRVVIRRKDRRKLFKAAQVPNLPFLMIAIKQPWVSFNNAECRGAPTGRKSSGADRQLYATYWLTGKTLNYVH